MDVRTNRLSAVTSVVDDAVVAPIAVGVVSVAADVVVSGTSDVVLVASVVVVDEVVSGALVSEPIG